MNANSKKAGKDNNFYTMNTGNFISGNGSGGLVTTNVGPQSGFNNSKDNKNNMSMLSSSTTDSNNIEVILEKVPSTNFNKQLIATTTPKNINSKFDVYNSKNFGIIAPPGQVLNTNNTYSNTSSKNNSNNNNNNSSNGNAKKLTQGIAAIAAQRKATQHHKELMQELGQNSNSTSNNVASEGLTASRLAKHDQSLGNPNQISLQDDHLFEKKNSVLTDGSNKAKKQVKIKEIVQFKLPSENTYLSEDTSFLVKNNSWLCLGNLFFNHFKL